MARAEFSPVREVKGTYQTGAKSEGDAKRIYRGLYYLGLLSHYSGDSTMPYHSASDWNGYESGLGGIHFYFEADCINALEPNLSQAVLEVAQKKRPEWLKDWKADSEKSAVGLMLNELASNMKYLPEIERLDKKHALTGKPSDKGSKAWPKRKTAREGCPKMRPLLIDRLAKASVLTALLWARALPAEGVDFSRASSLTFADFVWQPEYVKPEYGSSAAPAPASP
jgi:hypothetical protein